MNPSIKTLLLETEARKQWDTVGVRHHHGIAIPLFSIYTEHSSGIGEFLDLIPLIQWCHDLSLDIIQLLPLNDTGLGTSPYNAISAFALNPIHLSLHTLKDIHRVEGYQEKITKIRYWNKTRRVKHHIIRELKLAILRSYYEELFPVISRSEEYMLFAKENSWLKPYSLFRTIKELQFWREWEKWPDEIKNPSASRLQQIYETHQIECDFSMFLQFLCYQQMSSVKEYATKKGVMLKGDLPILIARDSVDTWTHPECFKLDYSVGAPPDMYSQEGQSWGFPLYDWDALAKVDNAWWKERLKLTDKLYHLYRIDHAVGFYRMWAIPMNKPATAGQFLPVAEEEQKRLGEMLMKMMLHSASALPIAEDLGMVPPWVKESLHKLGICTTKMMRWEKEWEGDKSFISPASYPSLSMTTVSTHDSDTLLQWWRHSPNEAKAFCEYKGWLYQPFLSPERLKEILYDSHHSNSLFHINLLSEYLSFFPELTDPHLQNTRINVPGTILERNWTYRLPISIELLIAHEGLRQLFKEIIN